jgi:hypothetical protein
MDEEYRPLVLTKAYSISAGVSPRHIRRKIQGSVRPHVMLAASSNAEKSNLARMFS